MAEIINLRRVKKRRARDAAADLAEQARARHGRTRAMQEADAKTKRATERALDAARIEGRDQS